jgi:hypothetical protein
MASNLGQRLAYKKNIQACLSELEQLSKKAPREAALLSLEETQVLRKSAMLLSGKPCKRLKIDFSEKESSRFAEFIHKLYQSNPSPVYIWTTLSNSCGLFEIGSILEFNFGFNFDINREGIISLLAKNMLDKMILDFSEDELGNKVLEVELIGSNWSMIEY